MILCVVPIKPPGLADLNMEPRRRKGRKGVFYLFPDRDGRSEKVTCPDGQKNECKLIVSADTRRSQCLSLRALRLEPALQPSGVRRTGAAGGKN